MVRTKSLDKLARAYYRVGYELITERDRQYPTGTKVRCTVTGMVGEVKAGSLYADRVYTCFGHSLWRNLEIIQPTGALDEKLA